MLGKVRPLCNGVIRFHQQTLIRYVQLYTSTIKLLIVQMQLYSDEVKVGIYQDKQELTWAYVEKGSDPYGNIYSGV